MPLTNPRDWKDRGETRQKSFHKRASRRVRITASRPCPVEFLLVVAAGAVVCEGRWRSKERTRFSWCETASLRAFASSYVKRKGLRLIRRERKMKYQSKW